MDQGIIQNLKVLYRRLYVTRALLPALDKKSEVQWSLLDALIAVGPLRDAWESVKPSTISNTAFRTADSRRPELHVLKIQTVKTMS